MAERPVYSILLILFLLTTVAAQQIDSPKLVPVPGTESQTQRIREGVALHDRGDYDGAIAKYEAVLKENPDNVLALYELAFSQSAKKEYKKSLETALKGAQYQSEEVTGFYLLIGNNLDELGEPKKAVELYKKALKLKPNDYLLHYNLGVTYNNMSNTEEAKKSLKKAVFSNPNHPSSHVLLATIWYKTHYKTPAIFAAARFLILEPRTNRSVTAFNLLQEIFKGRVKEGKNPGQIDIFVDFQTNKDEGDFGSIDLILGISGAAAMTEKNKSKSEVQKFVDQLEVVLSLMAENEGKGDKSKFTFRYYVPYFVELKKRNYVEPFGYYISQTSDYPGVSEWLDKNANRVNEFLNWSKNYRWPPE
ncbi:MAG TPA: tetratricopeptide repeat protein [Pyrinomonadaceae bacterium]|nr:tetratricopeptide repeat protein [Pyrinomonadaceae bacterium]